MQEHVDLSIVLPCYDEEENIAPLTQELVGVLSQSGHSYEILYVDDGSTDRSAQRIRAIQIEYPAVRLIQHGTNSGQSAALATGFRHARGKVIVTLDADLQNDPRDIPSLLEQLSQADLVCGVRLRRMDSWTKRISSKIGNAFRNLVTGDRITDAGCTLRAMKKEVIVELPVFDGLHRFLPSIARFQGFTVTEIPVNHRPRTAGRSKYGIRDRLWRGILDCLAVRWFKRRCVCARRVIEKNDNR